MNNPLAAGMAEVRAVLESRIAAADKAIAAAEAIVNAESDSETAIIAKAEAVESVVSAKAAYHAALASAVETVRAGYTLPSAEEVKAAEAVIETQTAEARSALRFVRENYGEGEVSIPDRFAKAARGAKAGTPRPRFARAIAFDGTTKVEFSKEGKHSPNFGTVAKVLTDLSPEGEVSISDLHAHVFEVAETKDLGSKRGETLPAFVVTVGKSHWELTITV